MTIASSRIKNPLRTVTSSVAARVIVTCLLGCALATSAYITRPVRASDLPRDARALTFVDRDGLPLGTILGRDDRHTIGVPLARMAPAYLAAVRATEDRRFAAHGALDPIAVLRALLAAARGGHEPRGASTLAMQLARELVPVGSGLLGKFRETLIAIRLENGLSRARILEAYANRAPMGSNIYGVEAASRTYFGVDAADLDLAQAALLAGLPNDPVRLDPYEHRARALARERAVLARMVADGAIDPTTAQTAARERLDFQPRSAGILAAPHALFFLAARTAPDQDRVRTTIDRPLQRFVEAQIDDVITRLTGSDVGQAAAIVIDNHTGDVLAYAGSRDYFATKNGGRNDGVQALRQPGSALKPFLYELALERRNVRPTTILADVPVTYALPGARIYRPSDYSERYEGPVRVRIALANSLNVPAVRVLERVGVPAYLDRLHALGFTHLTKSPDYYGLGLALGSGEVSLYELGRAYATLARGGAPTALRMTLDGATPADGNAGVARDDADWALIVNMLADPIARTAAFGTNSILSLPFDAAVKTGTSSDFRDTWTAGFTRDYTVAVWVGNFDGRRMRGISGVTGAAPLWNRIMLHLHAEADPAPFDPPRGYERRAVCATTGSLPFPACPVVVTEWLDAGDRAQLASTGKNERALAQRVTPNAAYDTWLLSSPDRERLPTRILFPREGDRFVHAPGLTLAIEVAGTRDVRVTLGGHPLARIGDVYLVPLRDGVYDAIARSRSAVSEVRFTVGPPLTHPSEGFTVLGAARSTKGR